jgi:signal transduction histidine kinase
MTLRTTRVDALVAVVLTGLGLVEALLGLTAPLTGWLPVALAPVVTLPVAVRGSAPGPALLVLVAAELGQSVAGSDLPGGLSEAVALALVLYAVGSRLPLRASLLWLAVGAVGVGAAIAAGDDPHTGNFVFAATVVLGAWAAGRVVRLAHERSGLLAEHRAQQERNRIARELHDVVSHNLTAIVVQAAAAQRGLDPADPSAPVLAGVEQHGRETLQELRRLLGLLRVDENDAGLVPLAPQPGLADLPRLLASARADGLEVSWTSTGAPHPVGSGLELAIYRVVQESLTNVRKHASDREARVSLTWREDRVHVEVVSGGHHLRGLPGAGFGLRSMAERVQAYGGELTARRTPDGFRVHAALPVDVAP